MFDPRIGIKATPRTTRAGEQSVLEVVDALNTKVKSHDSTKTHRRRLTQDMAAAKLDISRNDQEDEADQKADTSLPARAHTPDKKSARKKSMTMQAASGALATNLVFKLPNQEDTQNKERLVQAALSASKHRRNKSSITMKTGSRPISGKERHFEGVKIILPGVQVWRIMGTDVDLLLKDELCKFYSGDAYLIVTATPLHREGIASRQNQIEVHVHYWIGSKSTIDKRALVAIRAVQLSHVMEPRPTRQHREIQGSESKRLLTCLKKFVEESEEAGVEFNGPEKGEVLEGKNGPLMYVDGGCPSMLFHVPERKHTPRLYRFKGVKHIRVNQVELTSKSLNEGDSFLLDQGDVMYVWFGKKSNWRERSLCAQAAVQMKDAIKRSKPHIPTVTMEQGEEPNLFWLALEGREGSGEDAKVEVPTIASQEAGGDDLKVEKEVVYDLFEVDLIKGDSVEPSYIEQDKGGSIYMSKLRSDCVYVLDSRTEIFVYVGAGADPVQREVAIELAKQATEEEEEGKDFEEEKRPEWLTIKSMIHPYLHPMFTLKFADWYHHIGHPLRYAPIPSSVYIKPLNIQIARAVINGEELELAIRKNVSPRAGGECKRISIQGPISREYTRIIEKDPQSNIEIAVYEIKEDVLARVPNHCYGSFHSDRCYAVICVFNFKRTMRYAMFFWQGRLSAKSSYFVWHYDLMPALMEKMTETGYRCSPNVARIFQNREPEEFLELFDTGIVILAPPDGGDIAPPPPPMPSGDKMGSAHLEEQQPGLSAGKSDAISPKTESAMRFWRRMFHIRGASETLSRTHEVPCECSSLNSTDAFVVQETTSKFFIWYGALCSKIERTRAARAAVHIYSNLTEREDEEEEEEEIDLDRVFITVHEGKEPDRFWEAVGGKGNYTKFEASDTDQIANERLQNPILFEITLNRHYLMPRPILDYTSEDLHDSGVYMLDLHMWLFVWIGRRASERLVDGSMELAKAVVADRKGSKVVAVQAGKEPPEFTHAFLGWHEVRPFCDPYAKRAEKLAELGVVGRVLDVVPEDVQILREKRCKKEKKYRMNLTTGASTHYM